MDFIPHRDAELMPWLANYGQLVGVNFADYGLTQQQATAIAALIASLNGPWALIQNGTTRSPANIIQFQELKRQVVKAVRAQVRVIQANPGTTDQMRRDLRITVPAARQPVGVPGEAPVGEVVERFANVVRLKLHDGSGTRRGKPAGVAGASVFTFVGAVAPLDPSKWTAVGQTSRTTMDVPFDPELPAGTQVHLCAYWYNAKGESSVSCNPISTTLVGGQLVKAG